MERRPILVIDDDPRFCEFVSAALSRTGFEVLSAPDGPSGIELARAMQPTVILLDMMLPEVDGIATMSAAEAGTHSQRHPRGRRHGL